MFAKDCENIAKGLEKLKIMNVYKKGGYIVQVVSEVEDLLKKVDAHVCENDCESVTQRDELIAKLQNQIANFENVKSVDIKTYEDMKETILNKVSKHFEENSQNIKETLTEHEKGMFSRLDSKLQTELPFLIAHAIEEHEKAKKPWYMKIFKKSTTENIETKEIVNEGNKEKIVIKN